MGNKGKMLIDRLEEKNIEEEENRKQENHLIEVIEN
jgi:hypothetical protein